MEIRCVTANWLVSRYLRAANNAHLNFLAVNTQL